MDNSCKHHERKRPNQESTYCTIPFFKSTKITLLDVRMLASLEDGMEYERFLTVLVMFSFFIWEEAIGMSLICES